MNNFIPFCCPQIILPNCLEGVYVEVDNNTAGVRVHFTIQYTTRQGNTYSTTSPILNPGQIDRLNFVTTATQVLVWIYNDLTTPPSILTEGMLRKPTRTCFEINGTPSTVRCREVKC